jgi:hypothetical protein
MLLNSLAECVGVGANVVAIGILGFVVFKLIDVVIGLRADPKAEVEGLDIPEMGVPGYVGVTDGLRMPEFDQHASNGCSATAAARSKQITSSIGGGARPSTPDQQISSVFLKKHAFAAEFQHSRH